MIAIGNLCWLVTLVTAADVQVRELAGPTHTGRLVAISPAELVVETATGQTTFTTNRLASVVPIAPENESEEHSTVAGDVIVELVDGSQLAARSYRVSAGRVTIEVPYGEPLVAATRTVQAVRFQKQTADLRRQWAEIKASVGTTGDVLVLRKTLGETDGVDPAAVGLDFLEGVLGDIDDEKISFDFDGSQVRVQRQKVEGVIYYHRSASRIPEPTCRLTDDSGTAWNLKSLELDGELLKGVAASGVRLTLPLKHLTKLDFSIGNLVFLSDLEPEAIDWSPLIQTAVTPKIVSQWYRPRIDQAFDGGSLQFDSQVYEKGLALRSRTRLSYRLTRDFQRFVAVAGLDERFRGTGNVRLIVLGDGKELFSEGIEGAHQARLDLEVKGVRRLEIVVDFGDDNVSYGDYLNLCDARLLK